MPLSAGSIEELRWWFDALDTWDGRPIRRGTPDLVLFTDASQFAWGASVLPFLPDLPDTWGFWTNTELKLHITAKELKAVLLALKSYGNALTAQKILLRSDSVATVAAVNKLYSKSSTLATLVPQILKWTDQLDIRLWAEHIPGETNTSADRLSRMEDSSDWRLRPPMVPEVAEPVGPTLSRPHGDVPERSVTTLQL